MDGLIHTDASGCPQAQFTPHVTDRHTDRRKDTQTDSLIHIDASGCPRAHGAPCHSLPRPRQHFQQHHHQHAQGGG